MSKRIEDKNGFWFIDANPILKAGVFLYAGSEVPGGRPAGDIVRVYRPAEELRREETLASANLVPFINDHEMLGRDATPAEKKGVQGTTGETATFDGTYLRNSLRIFSDFLKGQIEGGKKDISAGYSCTYDPTPGTADGEAYDLVQRNIVFNHLALVDRGRNGPDVSVLDAASMAFDSGEKIEVLTEEQENMLTDEQKAEIMEMIKAALAELAEAKNEDTGEKPTEDPELPTDNTEPATIEKEEKKPPVATEPEHKEEDEEKPTVDAASIIKQIAERDKLAERVRPHIGTFDTAEMLSAFDVAKYAAKKLGLKSAAGFELATLEGYLQAVKAPIDTVQDSRPMFSNLREKFWGGK